jgi:hypothetical protein
LVSLFRKLKSSLRSRQVGNHYKEGFDYGRKVGFFFLWRRWYASHLNKFLVNFLVKIYRFECVCYCCLRTGWVKSFDLFTCYPDANCFLCKWWFRGNCIDDVMYNMLDIIQNIYEWFHIFLCLKGIYSVVHQCQKLALHPPSDMKQKIPFYVKDETSLTIFIKSPQVVGIWLFPRLWFKLKFIPTIKFLISLI